MHKVSDVCMQYCTCCENLKAELPACALPLKVLTGSATDFSRSGYMD